MKHMQYKHHFKCVFLIQLCHWDPISAWKVKCLLGYISCHIFRTLVCVWSICKHFSNSIKILSVNMDWSRCLHQTDLSCSACLQIHWPWLFPLACLLFVSLAWVDELIFLERYFRADDKWVAPRNSLKLAELLVTMTSQLPCYLFLNPKILLNLYDSTEIQGFGKWRGA